jgi:hypothetical protein
LTPEHGEVVERQGLAAFSLEPEGERRLERLIHDDGSVAGGVTKKSRPQGAARSAGENGVKVVLQEGKSGAVYTKSRRRDFLHMPHKTVNPPLATRRGVMQG